MSCEVEQIADCGDISNISRALFITEREGKCFSLFSSFLSCNLALVTSFPWIMKT